MVSITQANSKDSSGPAFIAAFAAYKHAVWK